MGGSKSGPDFLVLLLIVLFSGTSSYAHSLSDNVNIDPQLRDGQPWCEFQEVDQKVFLSCDCDTAKIKYINLLREEVKSMNAWETQTDTLRDNGDLLQEQMPDVTPEKHTGKGPLTLQVRMTCWQEDSGYINGSWESGFNGQLCLSFNLDSGHCTVHPPGGRLMKKKWKNDRAVTDCFNKVSKGDCLRCYQAFLEHCKKMLRTMASQITGLSTVQSSATASKHITWILPVVLTSFIIIMSSCCC